MTKSSTADRLKTLAELESQYGITGDLVTSLYKPRAAGLFGRWRKWSLGSPHHLMQYGEHFFGPFGTLWREDCYAYVLAHWSDATAKQIQEAARFLSKRILRPRKNFKVLRALEFLWRDGRSREDYRRAFLSFFIEAAHKLGNKPQSLDDLPDYTRNLLLKASNLRDGWLVDETLVFQTEEDSQQSDQVHLSVPEQEHVMMDREMLKLLIEKASGQQKRIIDLIRTGTDDPKEIAQELGCKWSTVRVQLFRLRKKN